MPELPEVETIRRDLYRKVKGKEAIDNVRRATKISRPTGNLNFVKNYRAFVTTAKVRTQEEI